MLFNKRPFPELDNELRVLTVIENRQSPWTWNDAVPLEQILSTCCHPREESRPSIDTILQKLQPFFNPSPSADAVAKASSATSFIRRLGRIGLGLVIIGSIISVCMGLSWIVRGGIAQSWPLTAVTMTVSSPTTTNIAIRVTPTFSPRVTTTSIPFLFTRYNWPIGMSLMVISLIMTSWDVLGRVSMDSNDRRERFIIAWLVVGPIIAAWVTASWAETSRTLLSCTRRSGPILIFFALQPMSGNRIMITTDWMWEVPSSTLSRAGHVALVTLTVGLVIWSDIALSWVLPGWIGTSLAAISLLAIGWYERARNSFLEAIGICVLFCVVTAAWVTTSWILLHLTHNLWLIAMSWIETNLVEFRPPLWAIPLRVGL